MKAIDLLLNRNSHAKLEEPAPNSSQLDIMFQAAMRAPDHAYLRPWRFITVFAEERVALGKLMLAATLSENKKENVELSDAQQQKILNMPLRSPMQIIVVNDYQLHAKVPKIEQELATGAALVNFQLAAEAQGFSSIWRTGALAHNETLLESLGFESNDQIIGFLYLGTSKVNKKNIKVLDSKSFVKTLSADKFPVDEEKVE
jgi:nitroreductase